MKVLIVKTSALGDIVHALPVVSYLHNFDSSLQIDWLVEKPFAPLLESQKQIHTVHRIDTKLWRRPDHISRAFVEIRNVIWLLRRKKYDVILDLQGNSKSGLFAFLTGTPLRYGFDKHSVREFPNLLSSNRKVAIPGMVQHISDRALKMAACAFPDGTMKTGSTTLTVEEAIYREVENKLRRADLKHRKLVLLHAGTTWRTKRMSFEFWKQLASELNRDEQLHLLFSWGNQEELVFAGRLKQAVPERSLVWPRVDLTEFMALSAQVDVVIGGDTGPVHIAAALGTPTVSFYRATDRRRNGPRGPKHFTFQSSMECSPCLLKTCPKETLCSDSVELDGAIRAVHTLLSLDS